MAAPIILRIMVSSCCAQHRHTRHGNTGTAPRNSGSLNHAFIKFGWMHSRLGAFSGQMQRPKVANLEAANSGPAGASWRIPATHADIMACLQQHPSMRRT
eukprot:164816-Chlamydomonas_euryale.AAC.1